MTKFEVWFRELVKSKEFKALKTENDKLHWLVSMVSRYKEGNKT